MHNARGAACHDTDSIIYRIENGTSCVQVRYDFEDAEVVRSVIGRGATSHLN